MKFISIFFLAVIASFNLHAAEVCIDPASDPDGDGWGFEQEASCFVVISGTGPNGELLSPAAVESQSVFHPRTAEKINIQSCLLYTSPSPRDGLLSRMPSSA